MSQDQEYQPTKDDIEHIREWLKKMPHIIQDYDDQFLEGFLRGCKGSLQKTKTVLENFNALGDKYPLLFGTYDPLDPDLQGYLTCSRIFPLPKKLEDGTSVLIAYIIENHDVKKFHPLKYMLYWVLSIYTYLWENNFGSGKWVLIADCKHLSFKDLRDLDVAVLHQMLQVLQTALPIRFQGMHAINVPYIMEYIFNFFITTAKKKIASRIRLHSNPETLFDHFPKEIFTKEFGGFEESVHDQWKEKLESYRTKFLEEESKMRKLDPLRPKTEDGDEMIGSFKKLNVD